MELTAGLTVKAALAGSMEIEVNRNKHKDRSQAGKSGECLVVDPGYTTGDVGTKMSRFRSASPCQDFVPILWYRELGNFLLSCPAYLQIKALG